MDALSEIAQAIRSQYTATLADTDECYIYAAKLYLAAKETMDALEAKIMFLEAKVEQLEDTMEELRRQND